MFAHKYQSIIISFLMALLMSGIMSLVLGFSIYADSVKSIFWLWLDDWFLAFWVAFPTTLFITPLVKKLTLILVKSEMKNN